MKRCAPGILTRHSDFPSKYVIPHHVDIWLPPGYGDPNAQGFPVIYMHDGQNVFDSTYAFLGVDWGMGDTMNRLIGAGEIQQAIIVGIWNTSRRHREYMPQKPLQSPRGKQLEPQFIEEYGGVSVADNYLRFITQELKVFIDRTYYTRPEREHTAVMGSSMGGLISLYALCEYPDVFAAAGCISTHWPIAEGIVIDYLKTALPKPGLHKIYFDYGTETLDRLYEPYQQQVDALMRQRGYSQGVDWITRCFNGAEHSERAWRERVHIPLKVILGNASV